MTVPRTIPFSEVRVGDHVRVEWTINGLAFSSTGTVACVDHDGDLRTAENYTISPLYARRCQVVTVTLLDRPVPEPVGLVAGTTTNADRIEAWRRAHPGVRLTAALLREILGLATLRGADFRSAYLPDAYLTCANLRGADFRGAYLMGANLMGAVLRGANLRGVNLTGAYLANADLSGILTVTGLPSGDLTMVPTPEDGWWLRVDGWSGTVDQLAELVAQDTGWPEAHGEEVARRRRGLEAAIMLARAHIALHPDAIERVTRERAKWGAEEATQAGGAA